MFRTLLTAGLVLATARAAPAGVLVLANYTPDPVTLSLATGKKGQEITLKAGEVRPVRVGGPVDVTFPAKPAAVTLRLEPYHAYVLIPDEKAGRRLEGVELPGDDPPPPERELPDPPAPVAVKVRLLVDDADPRADALWRPTLKARLEAAAAVVEAHSGIRFVAAGYDAWVSDPAAKTVPALLTDFEAKVAARPAELVVGYTSRRVETRGPDAVGFGAHNGRPSQHLLVREFQPKSEAGRVEVLAHHLGLAAGAVPLPDPLSVMRPRLVDGLADRSKYVTRFDPLNALAMSIWAEEMGRDPPAAAAADVTPANRARLARVYQAALKLKPADPLALTYLNQLDRGAEAQGPPPKKDAGPPAGVPAPSGSRRTEVAKLAVKAFVARSRENTARTKGRTGDELMAEYVRAAAAAAVTADATDEDRAAGLALGLAVALDDGDDLRADPRTADAVRAVESDADRDRRLGHLGNPTVRGRRDLCRRFAVGCGTGLLLDRADADRAAADRAAAAAAGPGGVSFPGLAAELAGGNFARRVLADPAAVRRLAERADVAGLVPDPAGLRDGLSAERFAEDYGGPADDRFRAVLDDIRGRVGKGAGR